jgi:hypothetical protein
LVRSSWSSISSSSVHPEYSTAFVTSSLAISVRSSMTNPGQCRAVSARRASAGADWSHRTRSSTRRKNPSCTTHPPMPPKTRVRRAALSRRRAEDERRPLAAGGQRRWLS